MFRLMVLRSSVVRVVIKEDRCYRATTWRRTRTASGSPPVTPRSAGSWVSRFGWETRSLG